MAVRCSARSIIYHKRIEEYQEAARVAGPSGGVPGLTAAELAHRAALRKAKADVRKGKRLAQLWGQCRITADSISSSDRAVLQNHWDRSDVQHLLETQAQGKDRNFKMPQLWNK